MCWALNRECLHWEKLRIQRGPDPTPDFQVEAEEDIKSETSDILQELLLALAKVRRTGLQGRGWRRVESIALV